jgi:hypothetical protein
VVIGHAVGEDNNMGDDMDMVVACVDHHNVVGSLLEEVHIRDTDIQVVVKGDGTRVAEVDEMAVPPVLPDCTGQLAKLRGPAKVTLAD